MLDISLKEFSLNIKLIKYHFHQNLEFDCYYKELFAGFGLGSLESTFKERMVKTIDF